MNTTHPSRDESLAARVRRETSSARRRLRLRPVVRAVMRRASVAVMALVLAAAFAVRAQEPLVAPRTPAPAPAQPLPYSHRQHIELGLECRECHVNPDEGALMTFPSNDTCMSCHATMPAGTPALKQLVTLAAAGRPIPWVRVYRVADYVYWSHAPHLAAEVACTTCHGPVPERDVIALETAITTKRGCVTCHEAKQVYMDCGDCHEPRQ